MAAGDNGQFSRAFQGKVGDEEVARLLRGWKWDGRLVHPTRAIAIATTLTQLGDQNGFTWPLIIIGIVTLSGSAWLFRRRLS